MERSQQGRRGQRCLVYAGRSGDISIFTKYFWGLFPSGRQCRAERQCSKVCGKKQKAEKRPKRKHLDTYCYNLTQKAKDGKLDAIIGRDKEIGRVVQILSRRTKNNPCLIGEPGVGKTAIAEGLALRIASGNVPARLRTKEIHLLDLTALVAGTSSGDNLKAELKAW